MSRALPVLRPDRGDRARRRLPAAAAPRAAAAGAAQPRRLRRRDRRAAADPLPAPRPARRAAARRAGADLARGRAAVPALPRDRVARAAPRGRARRGLQRPRGRRGVTLSVIAIVGVVGAALGIGTYGVRLARTTSDLFVASRAVTPWWNAAAISGEYLSAASFLGVAGLMLKFGASALWLPVGFTAGYLTLLLFVAAPLRRFGSYTIPDFAEARLPGRYMRLLAAAIVLLISGCYLVPAAQGRGRDPARRDRRAVLGRGGARGRDRRAQRRAGRDARRDLRAGLPVLGEGVRDRVPRDPAADPPRRPAGAGRAVRLRAAEHRPGRDGGRARPAAHADLPRHGRDADRPRGRAATAAGHRRPRGRGHRRPDRRRVVAPGLANPGAARRC